ncbi:putative 2OG-Fe(II) oxygenase [Prochlorococcus marinus]|uniref:putative 2OG-Fe(II) oxygenase n=1 Tax=Prochlorococcus marinus TaxID=1219 RepID=UPI0022B4D1B1|nr:putative 2OG-Fe(II) oxygenase [Prochlorococcus marinus]
MTERTIDKKEGSSKLRTFPIPIDLGEIKENFTISTNSPSQLTKEQIINQAFKFHSEGNILEAGKYYKQLIKQRCNDHRVFSNYGIILKNSGKLKQAEISTRKAIELNPNYAEAHCNLGNILKDLGKLKEAEISFSKSIELNPDYTLALSNRAQLFFDKEEFEKALKDSDSCNTKNCRAFSLEILFSLGRIQEIFNRIENSCEIDNENIRLAAFSSFISKRENKETYNNFCPNPLSFLHFNNLNFYVKNYKEFIKKIINELSDIKTIWEPLNKATHNGFQTPNDINLFSNSSENISYLKSIIVKELDSYFLKFKKDSCSYIQKWPSNKDLKAWHVVLKTQGYQSAHIHPGGWLSGVIYLKVVPPMDKDEGAIEFSLNGQNYFDANSPKLIHQPEAGDIVLFPSSLHHRTIPFSTDTERIVIAFDLVPD